MIQELLGGSNVGLLGGDRSKISTPGIILDGSPYSQSPSPAASPSPASSSAAPTAVASTENLRCPRCDSSNTKFCYYNNYNLTQPRHFCKTCRRYWTKGGALRNVPIGGGCRKNKSTTIAAAVGKSSVVGKLKSVTNEIGRSGALFNGGFDQGEPVISANPIIWAASSQNSHFLSLLRANQNPNGPNPNPGHLPNSVKDEGALSGSSHYWGSESSISGGGINGRVLNLDPLGQLHITPTSLSSNSVFRNQSQPNQAITGELQQNGFQELYQRLRSSTCYPDHAPLIPGNLVPATSSAILESAPVATGELGFWNSTLYWPNDMPTSTNGAYP